MRFTYLSDVFAVAPMITPEDLNTLKSEGFTTIICNRPDDEDVGQISQATMSAAAAELGLDFHFLPMRGWPDPACLLGIEKAIKPADGKKVLAYCKSGTRSAFGFAMAALPLGLVDPASLHERAARGGYDLSPLFR